MRTKKLNMLLERKAARHRLDEYFHEVLNVEDVEASIEALGGDRRMSVFGRLNNGGVKNYEVKEGPKK